MTEKTSFEEGIRIKARTIHKYGRGMETGYPSVEKMEEAGINFGEHIDILQVVWKSRSDTPRAGSHKASEDDGTTGGLKV